MGEIDTYPAGSVGLNDSTIDFQNDFAQYVMKKGDVIWIEYDDPSAVDGATYILILYAVEKHSPISAPFVIDLIQNPKQLKRESWILKDNLHNVIHNE